MEQPMMLHYDDPRVNQVIREVYAGTEILRRPMSGIVSGYHELPYVLVVPDRANAQQSVRLSGTIRVSPRFVITPGQLPEAFAEVFDPETFDGELHARLFSFASRPRKDMKVSSSGFATTNSPEPPREHLDNLQDIMAREENTRTALLFGPKLDYYPVSIDRLINEIADREFRV
jgi:hypothetical protein